MTEICTFEISEKTQSLSSSNSYIISPKQTYRITGHWFTYTLAIIFLLGGITFLVLGIKELITDHSTSIHNFLLFVVLLLISCIITYFFPFYISITVDLLNKIVIVKKYKLFFIIKKVVTINTEDINKAYTEKHFSNGENTEDGFNLVFELKNREKLLALEGEADRNFEMIKLGYFLNKFFPGLEKSQQMKEFNI
jgi:hypothetical protein